MVGHLVRLKLLLLRRGLRTAGSSARIGLGVSLTIATLVGLTIGLSAFSTRSASDDGAGLAIVGLFTLVLLVWVLGPLVSVGAENTLEVDKLNLLPLGGKDLVPGLCVASLIGSGGLATTLLLVGAVAGMAPLNPSMALTLWAATLQLAVCIAASRVVSTTLAGVRSRRWRDVALFVGPLAALGFNLTFQLMSRNARRLERIDLQPFRPLRVAAHLLPSGAPAEAMAAAREGRFGTGLVWCALGTLYLAALFALWWRALQRTMTNATVPTGPRDQRRRDLYPALARFLPRTRTGAVAAKELRVTWREPRQRAALLSSLFPAAIIGVSSGVGRSRGPGSVLYGAAFVLSFGASSTTLFGFDGARHWMNVAAGEDIRADLVGKVIARLFIAVPLGVLATFALAFRHGSLELVPAGLGLSALGLGLTLGSGVWVSVVSAHAVADASNPWSGGRPGQGSRAVGPGLLSFFGSIAAMAPFVAATLLLRSHPFALALLILSECAIGFAVWRTGLAVAVRSSQHRQPELLEALSARRA